MRSEERELITRHQEIPPVHPHIMTPITQMQRSVGMATLLEKDENNE